MAKIKLKTSYFVLAGIFLPLIFMAPELEEDMQDSSDKHAALMQEQEAIADRIEDADLALMNSEVALARIKGACVPLVDLKSGEVRRFSEGGNVYSEAGSGRGKSSNEILAEGEELPPTFEDGVCVANSMGDTAITLAGRMVEVARTAPADMETFTEFFEKQAGSY